MLAGVTVGEFWPHSGGVQALEQIPPPALVKPGRYSHPSPHLYGETSPWEVTRGLACREHSGTW